MKITNAKNLPAPFVRMAKGDEEYTYKEHRYSATTLLKPVREILLKRRHDSELEQDCADMIWLLFGRAVHKVLEDYGTKEDGESAEMKLAVDVDGYTVSGILDYYNEAEGLVVDYKTASVWKVIMHDFKDWEQQGMTYAWLLWKNGLPVKRVEFYAILKDHSKTKAKFDKEYPDSEVVKIEFAVTESSLAAIDSLLVSKLEELKKYEGVPDDELPVCTPEERWNDGDRYAVMKKGRKSALRVLDSMEAAEEYMAANGGDYIETRLGEDKKCEEYCLCCKACSHWRERHGE